MSTEIKGYRPLSPESTDRILDAWEWYKSEIGLEGKITYNVRKANEGAKKVAIASHRERRSRKIGDFQEVKRIVGIGSERQAEEKE